MGVTQLDGEPIIGLYPGFVGALGMGDPEKPSYWWFIDSVYGGGLPVTKDMQLMPTWATEERYQGMKLFNLMWREGLIEEDILLHKEWTEGGYHPAMGEMYRFSMIYYPAFPETASMLYYLWKGNDKNWWAEGLTDMDYYHNWVDVARPACAELVIPQPSYMYVPPPAELDEEEAAWKGAIPPRDLNLKGPWAGSTDLQV